MVRHWLLCDGASITDLGLWRQIKSLIHLSEGLGSSMNAPLKKRSPVFLRNLIDKELDLIWKMQGLQENVCVTIFNQVSRCVLMHCLLQRTIQWTFIFLKHF